MTHRWLVYAYIRRHCRHVYGSGGIPRGQVHARFTRVVSHEFCSWRFLRASYAFDLGSEVGGRYLDSIWSARALGFFRFGRGWMMKGLIESWVNNHVISRPNAIR